jgi:3-dehydroquinate synthase
MSELKVKIPAIAEGAYPIHIGTDTLCGVWVELEKEFPKLRKFVVTDSNLKKSGHLKTLIGDNKVCSYVIDPAGEVSKTIETIVNIVESMEKEFFGRDSMVVALGGGTVGDMAGFAAAIFKRGVKVVQIPTTTVAQADSSVGGKTGVDSTISKNAFGSFYMPEAVYIDVATLKTLDDVQYRAGLVESVKHALIADAKYFGFLEKNIQAVLDKDLAVLEKIAFWNCTIKAGVVEKDPTEKNMRRILNFGHTIGHAVESASNFDLLHGEAVSIGIVGAELIAQELGFGDAKRLERIKELLGLLSMPLVIPNGLDKDKIIDIIKRDKKAVDLWPNFVLIEGIGKALCKDGQWAHKVDRKLIEKTLGRLKD